MPNEFVKHELFKTICDEEIGSGIGRTVFSSEVLPDCVIKCEGKERNFQNIVEWQVWQAVKETPFAKWFSPCEWISPSGAVLIMKRTKPAKRLPKEIPAFFTDIKPENFGIYKGHLVCHDYGYHLLLERGMTNRMRKAVW